MVINISVQYNGGPEGLGVFLYVLLMLKKNLNASKPSEHPPQVEECLKV